MGLHWQFGVVQGASGPSALSISVEVLSDPLILDGAYASGFPKTSSAGDIHVQATASGGDGSYSYAWSVSEAGDNSNTATGNVQIASAGTPTGTDYDDITISANLTGVGQFDPPIEAEYQFTCTVTDGNGDTAQATEGIEVVVFWF